MVWRIDDPQGNEAAKVKYDIVRYTRGRGLDLGCGPSKAFPHFIGVDSGKDTQLFGVQMKPDVIVEDCSNLSLFSSESMDFVFSSHLLEHIEDTQSALAEWWRVIKPGGYLVLYLPHRDLYPNVGTEGANPDHKHDFVPADIRAALLARSDRNIHMEAQEVRADAREYSFLQIFRKGDDAIMPKLVLPKDRPAKTACVVRYGAFGDMLQASNVLPALKREGYHVTVMTTPSGKEIIRHDPNVDDWILQDPEQVPNAELWPYWEAQKRHFDKWVNLSESVEGTLLAMEGRAHHMWPARLRHQLLNHNYLEVTSEIAEVPYRSEARFYATSNETKIAQERIDRLTSGIENPYVILWALSGSAPHKSYPWTDAVLARLMSETRNVVVFLVGDAFCLQLECGWEKEPRIAPLSTKISIRETLALAQCVDCVVGPETGVLNAVAFDRNVSKVIFLSHSSPVNLTKHWIKTQVFQAEPDESVKPCALRPCHQLHFDRTYCPQDAETGAAVCQARINPHKVFDAIAQLAKVFARKAA